MDTINIHKPMGAARFVRREKYAWPGGYALALIMDDGQLLCATCVQKEFHYIAESFRRKTKDGWFPVGITHTGEMETDEYCAHCDAIIK